MLTETQKPGEIEIAHAELEPVPRGPYCGAVGWVDADRGVGELAVGIRTFWISDGALHFGTGAGITWGSDPDREWAETELKAARLLRVAQGKLEEDESMARRAGADAEGTSSEAVPERPPPPYGTGTEEDDST